jgi:trans-aconitate 2-methyltransferase
VKFSAALETVGDTENVAASTVADWDGSEYARVSELQRAMARDAVAVLALGGSEKVLDIGCGDGILTRAIAANVPRGYVVGLDPAQGMLSAAMSALREEQTAAMSALREEQTAAMSALREEQTAAMSALREEQTVPTVAESGPVFVRGDARHLPFLASFDVVVSFNALHWVPEQNRALAQIAAVLSPGGRVLIQLVCAGRRTSVEDVAMELTRSPQWARWFAGFPAPFVHVDSDEFKEMASSTGFTIVDVTVAEREWDFGAREPFERWCAVGGRAWTDRLAAADRSRFVAELVSAYEQVSGRPGLFLFTQMRAELRR